MKDPEEIKRQLKKLDDWERHVATIDTEAIVKQRLQDLKDSNDKKDDDSTVLP